MWFLKKNLLGLALVVGAVCSSFAGEPTYQTDVYPLTFGTSYTNDQQLEMWKRLMKYKLFATGVENSDGIYVEERVRITDEVGYIGSAHGDFRMRNNEHKFGGPVLFGGAFYAGTGGDTLLTGPARFKKTFTAQGSSMFRGSYCFDGGYNGAAGTGVSNGGGTILTASQCTSYDVVYNVDGDLDVPSLGISWPTGLQSIATTVNERVKYIHVPPDTLGDSSAYVLYLSSISFTGDAATKLHVVMPPNGRLTKIYVRNGITFGNTSFEITVVYAKGQSWNTSTKKWSGEGSYTPLTNSEYGGNLLFYMPTNFTIPTAEKTMQGTYISAGDLTLGHHTRFAGQLIAKYIRIGADFDAQDFRYVPFNPPQIGISLASNQAISEDDPGKPEYQDGSGNYIGTRLQVELSKKPDTDVKFDYCFQFTGTVNSGSNLANFADIDTSGTRSLPICGKSTKTAVIPKDSIRTKDPIRVWIVDDVIEESPEFFQLVASNLVGGVFSDNSREWPIQFRILDNDHSTPCNVISGNNSVTIPEDASIALTNGAFPAFCSDSTTLTHKVIIKSTPAGGTLKLNGNTVSSGASISSNDLRNLVYTPNANRNGTPYDSIKFQINDPAESKTTSQYTLKINVTPVNDAPTADACNKTLNENVSKGTSVCQVKGHDVDSLTKASGEKYTLSYSIIYGNVLDENGALPFSITNTGAIKVNGKLNYERINYYPLIVRVTDGSAYVDVPVNVTINDVNEKPDVTGFDTTVVENGGIGQYVGRIDAYDPEYGRKFLTYSITSGDPNGVFEIRKVVVQGDTVALVYTKKNIDYESLSSQGYKYTLNVKVTDKGGNDSTVQAIIRVTNEDEVPTVKNDTCEIVENSTTWTKGCSIVATDPEGGAMTYTIAEGNGSSLFSINGSGAISVTSAPNYEEGNLYLLGIDVSDGANTTRAWALVRVVDINEPPTATVRNGTVEENSTAGTPVDCVVGGVLYHCVEGSDEDAGTALNYSIVGGDTAGVFTINSTGDILVAKDYAIDYEKQSSYDLTIRICDNGKPGTTPSCIELPSTVTVIDGNELPTATGFTVTIRENAPVDSVVGKVKGTDPEGDSLTYSFGSGNNGKAFSIDSKTGKVKVAREIDFEALTKKTFEIQVFVNDGHNRVETQVKITIKDINEGPEIDDATMTVAENQPKGTTVGSMMDYVYDPDSPADFRKNTFTAVGGDKAKFTIDANTGVIKTNDVFDYEAQKSYTLLVQVKDPDGNADTATVTINISDVKESSKIVVTHIETGSGAKKQDYPNISEPYLINENAVVIDWTADGIAKDTLVTNLKEGYNVVTLTYKDPTKNTGATENVVIFVSTRTPEVTVTTSAEQDNSSNIFTLVETVDESDTSVYVNKKNNDIVVTVKEPVLDESYTDSTCNYESTSFTVNTELEPVTIPSNTYEAVNAVVKAAPVLNENPISEVTYSQYNGDQTKVSYTEKVAGVDVVISYVVDKNGNVEKIPVVGANGKIDSIEVMTVSYQISVNGKTVNVSYVADAATGQALKTTTVAPGTIGTANAGTSNNGSNSGKPGSSNSGTSNSGSNSGNGGSNGGSNSGNGGSNGSGNGGSGSASASNSDSGIGNAAPVYAYSLTEGEVLFSVTYDYNTKAKGIGETTVQVSYTVDQKGKVTKDKDGNVGYEVSYTYVNEMGNSATQSVYIVVDLIPPKVKILSPEDQAVLHSNMVEVQWCVDLGDGLGCQIQDSLTVEGLQPGEINEIVRFYRDKAGNEASAVVYVMAKNTKDVDISVEKPVTNITKEDVDKYYASKKPEEGQTFAVSIYNPQADKEIETQVGGSFKNKAAKPGEEVYPGMTDHLGPTLGIETKVPVINSVNGLATLDDLVGTDGMILLDAVDAVGSKKVTVEEFVKDHCTDEFKSELGSDISKANIYDTKMSAKIWIYTSLGQFVDYFSFTQDLNDPSYASDAGVLTLYFEMKPDENGDLHTDNGRLYATGAYVYKTEFTMKSTLRCDLPPFDEATNVNKMNQTKKVTEDLLKSFGYKRPKSK